MNEADEICGQNSDKFDIKWIRTRCIFHGISMFPDYQSIDTLKLAKAGFNFNSNKLDYLGQFLGFGGKMDTGGFKIWQNIVVDNCSKSMKTMVDYCKKDVILLEKVFNKLNPYTKHKHHFGVIAGRNKCSCPNCTSNNTVISKNRITASGIQKVQMNCIICGKYFTVSKKVLEERNK